MGLPFKLFILSVSMVLCLHTIIYQLSVDQRKFVKPSFTYSSLRLAVEDRARNSITGKYVLLAAVVDRAYLRMALNFYHSSIKPHGLSTTTLFLCVDRNSCTDAQRYGLTSLLYVNLTDGKCGTYNSEVFNIKSHIKIKAVHEILLLGYDVILSDLDVTFFKSPITYLLDNCGPDCDILLEVDLVDPQLFNTGFYFVKSSNRTINLFGQVLKFIEHREGNDQEIFNDVLQRHSFYFEKYKIQLKHRVKVKSLPTSLFPNGNTYFAGNMTNNHFGMKRPTETFLVHHNWIVGTIAKEYRMKEAHMWVLDERGYYSNRTAKYITYRNYYTNILANSTLVSIFQGKALRNALAIAKITNRILILPKFHLQNLEVPAQFKLSISKLYSEFGDMIRESSFLENLMVPLSVSNSKQCMKPLYFKDKTNEIGGLLPIQISSEYILNWIKPHSTCPVIKFDSLHDISIKFNDSIQHLNFNKAYLAGIVEVNDPIQTDDIGLEIHEGEIDVQSQ